MSRQAHRQSLRGPGAGRGAARPPAAASPDHRQLRSRLLGHAGRRPPRPDRQFELDNPGQPEVRKDIVVEPAEGVFGNPGAIFKCRSADFAVNHCPPDSQAGIVTIIANYEGNPTNLLGTAPVYNMETVSDDETARLAFVAPTVNIPITIPIAVRSASDYGLRLTVTGISQQIPLHSRRLHDLGLPGRSANTTANASRTGSPGNPPGCPGAPDAGLHLVAVPASRPCSSRPYTDNPSICTGEPLRSRARRRHLPGPDDPDARKPTATRRRPAAKNRSSTRSSTSA